MEHIPVKIRAEKSWCRNAIELLIIDPSFPRDGEVKVITSMIGETRQEGTVWEPSAILEFREAQVLMDDLWQAGLRPTEGTGSAGYDEGSRESPQRYADARVQDYESGILKCY